mgnify:CR=1 FL=1
MHIASESVEELIQELSQLPSVGRKTATRLASYILKMSREDVRQLADALMAVKDRVTHCSVCHNVTDQDPCPVCRSHRRDHEVICVVEEPNDVMAIERTNEYQGVYHVLGGVISPLDGVGPEDLTIRELVDRVAPGASNGQPEDVAEGVEDREVAENEDGSAEETRAAKPETDPSRDGARTERGEQTPSEGDSEATDLPEPGEVREVIIAVNPNVEGDTTTHYIAQLLEPFDVTVSRLARGLPIGGDLEFTDEATLGRALSERNQL